MQNDLHDVTVFAGDSVALDDFACRGSYLGDLLELPDVGANSQDRGHLVTKSTRIELGSVSKDGARLLETTKPVGDGARRQTDTLAELAAGESSLLLKL